MPDRALPDTPYMQQSRQRTWQRMPILASSEACLPEKKESKRGSVFQARKTGSAAYTAGSYPEPQWGYLSTYLKTPNTDKARTKWKSLRLATQLRAEGIWRPRPTARHPLSLFNRK